MEYSVYVRPQPRREHYKDDFCYFCGTRDDAVTLAKWLIFLGLDAQPIDQDVFEAMPDKLDGM